jgi:sterol desaturase/sphingolipid hydroxylase (fatty acid hydroxylase superfamily)
VSNFGTKLAIWDWILGAAYRPPKKPGGYGLAEAYPRGYLEQHAFAFRPFARADVAALKARAPSHKR